MNPIKAIREKCIDCCGGSRKEVELCTVGINCPLYDFRFGKNPYRKKRVMTEEQRIAAAERLAKARRNKNE